MPPGEQYRRLPGRRRAIGSNSSLWLGSDHILLVKSAWFREEYKRFYLRDIQAVVVAPCPRFVVSTPLLIFSLLWLLLGFGLLVWPASVAIGWGVGLAALVFGWLGLSFGASCRCRLYTAVSRDDLPSLFRRRSARRFLRQVQPRIEQVQGVLDSGWAEAERSSAGPAADPLQPSEAQHRGAAARSHTPISDLFVLSLFVGPLVGLATVHAAGTLWFRVNSGFNLLELVGAIAVLVDYYRGRVGRAMQRLSIAALVLIGVMFYVQTFTYSFTMAIKNLTMNGPALGVAQPWLTGIHQATDGVGLLLGFIGAAVTLRREPIS